MRIDLSEQLWHLACWRPYGWMMRRTMETGEFHKPEIGPLEATIPCSVQTVLRKADLIEDWNVGLNSNKCEWIEHRHWEFYTDLASIAPGSPAILEADGLDHSGWILVDAKIVATFEGSLLRHRFDLTQALADGRPHRLSIVFDEPPREQGQIGFTSRSRHFKPRFSYSWDWCPRIVPVGIWDTLVLRTERPPGQIISVRTHLNEDLASGRVEVIIDCEDDGEPGIGRLILIGPADDFEQTAKLEQPLRGGVNRLEVPVERVRPWWPNGMGDQPLYRLSVQMEKGGAGNADALFNVGFKRVRWLACEEAPQGAEPWLCEINGKPIFLQGVNWTPISPDYAAVTRPQYARLIDLYKAMGVNLLRVWGGAFLEKHDFYDLCDYAGILVWQEFPLSSSGYDNYAPDDPATIERLCTIATDYIRRRGHHASKLMWCGGNELLGVPNQPGGVPHDRSHPALAALAQVVEREDPGTRFIPASPSGPTFSASASDFGKGVHHDVHGPWNFDATLNTIEKWREYWQQDDALFRSETGMPATSSVDILNHYSGDYSPWPPSRENLYWMHTAAWWLQWERFGDQVLNLGPKEGLERFVELSQQLQAEALSIAASACKDRFPHCGGFLVWMGHDCFPCAANTSIIDFLGRPKPAYHALAEVFRTPANRADAGWHSGRKEP